MLVGNWVDRSPEIDGLLQHAARLRIPVEKRERDDFSRIAGSGNHQGVAVEASAYPYVPLDELVLRVRRDAPPPLVLLLDQLQDPQNLGALLRTADAVGADGVVIPSRRSASVTPAAVRASAGAAEHVPVTVVTNLVRTLVRLRDTGLWFTGLEAAPDAPPYTDLDFRGPTGLVIGSEGTGLRRLVRESCDFLARVPLHGTVSSLNASVASAVVMYEVKRQRNRADSANEEVAARQP